MLFLIALTACSTIPEQVIKTEYIKQSIPPLPERAQYYSVKFLFKDGGYWLDEINAKNLLKNKVLSDGYTKELEDILQGLSK